MYNQATPDRWLSGRKRPPAKWVGLERGLSGSNPDLSASIAQRSKMKSIFLRYGFHFTLVALAASAQGQTLKEYLALRKQHGITRAAGVESLETFLGSRVVEVQCVVRGSFGFQGKTVYLVERPDGGDLAVSAARPVEWLEGNEVHCRLIVKASRASEGAELKAELLGAAMEIDIAKVDSREKQPPARNSSRTSPLRGPIGSGGGKAKTTNWNLPTTDALPYYAAFIKKYNKKLSEAQALEIAHGIIGFSIRYGVDARLIMAMVLVESGFNPNDTSYAGAMGLGQLMPGTARGLGITNAYDTYQNLYGTTRLIRGHIDKYTKQTGSDYEGLVLALAAYNAGSGAVRRHGGVPPYKQTQRYIEKVISTYRRFLGE